MRLYRALSCVILPLHLYPVSREISSLAVTTVIYLILYMWETPSELHFIYSIFWNTQILMKIKYSGDKWSVS